MIDLTFQADRRCETDPTYHERLRKDVNLFDKEAYFIGHQGLGIKGVSLTLGLCRGCKTTICRYNEQLANMLTSVVEEGGEKS